VTAVTLSLSDDPRPADRESHATQASLYHVGQPTSREIFDSNNVSTFWEQGEDAVFAYHLFIFRFALPCLYYTYRPKSEQANITTRRDHGDGVILG
jgi:hypothetical protein